MPKKKAHKSCKKGYSCGAGCISVKYACRKEFTEGVSVSIDGTRKVIMNNIKQESESEVKPPAPAPEAKPEPKKEETPKAKPKKETPKEDPDINVKEEAAEIFLKDANRKKAFKERLEGEAKDLKKEMQDLNKKQNDMVDEFGDDITNNKAYQKMERRYFEALNEFKEKNKEIQKLGDEYNGLMAKAMDLKGDTLAKKLGNKTSYEDVDEGVNGKRSKEAKELHEDLRAIANGDKPKHTKKGEELEDLRSKYGRFLDDEDNANKIQRLKDEGLDGNESRAVAQWLHLTNYDIINKNTRDDQLRNTAKDKDKESKAQMLKDLNTGIMKLKKQTYNHDEMQSIAQSRGADPDELRTDGRLVRGIKVPNANKILDSFRSKIGKEHYEPTVMGTTALRDEKLGFTSSANVKFSIKPKKNSNGKMVDEFKNYVFEGEVLFPSNTRFGVVDVVGDTVYLQEL